MAQHFILPTIFSVFIGIWYWTFQTQTGTISKVTLHIFTVIARTFYGMLVSLPFELVLQIVLARMLTWIFFLILAVDILQIIIILQDFNHYILSDAIGVLFGILYVILDLFFLFQVYALSTTHQLGIRKIKPKNKDVIGFNKGANILKEIKY